MAENTKIEWATHSFSPWIGCSRVHAGCTNCYAETMAGRLGVTWGPNGTRRRTANSTWKKVELWNQKATRRYVCERCGGTGTQEDGCYDVNTGRYDSPAGMCRLCGSEGYLGQLDRPRVFPSLCDPFEDWWGPILDARGERLAVCEGGGYEIRRQRAKGQSWATIDDVRRDFFALIDRCQNLDFLLLTKRPENVRRMWEEKPQALYRTPCDVDHRENVWLLYSASNQATLDAGSEYLRKCRDLCPVQGFSLEPLLGPVVVPLWVDLVIVGGESGPNARPCNIEWIRSIVEQCREAGVPCFVKQIGANAQKDHGEPIGWPERTRPRDPKGGDWDEWPEDLRVQEYPR